MSGFNFVDYVLSFYGPGEIYDYGFTREEVETAVKAYKGEAGATYQGDSFDREMVREIVFRNRKIPA
ncbi:MAG TPA: hypothetical protein VFM18_17675 [Methanosarcina sp.]|nr:hypothetical protein [Methanosarcina sp.]